MVRGTLTHGDPRVDNILFIDGPRADDVQAVLIDWQLTGWRNPMHDVGYFLSGSVSVEDRRAHERDFLDRYAETIGFRYTLAEVTADYRVQLLSGLMTTVACYGLIPLTPAFDALLIALLRRNAAAAADWESLAAVRAAG
jgi:thiamine kinase-like enzyme